MTDLPRLLTVIGHPALRTLVEIMLKGHARLVFAPDGRATLAHLSEGGWDGALIDLGMPVLDAPAALRAWRAHEAEHGMPRLGVLALAAEAPPDGGAAIREAGFDGHLALPFTARMLRRAVTDHLDAPAPIPPRDPAPPPARRA